MSLGRAARGASSDGRDLAGVIHSALGGAQIDKHEKGKGIMNGARRRGIKERHVRVGCIAGVGNMEYLMYPHSFQIPALVSFLCLYENHFFVDGVKHIHVHMYI